MRPAPPVIPLLAPLPQNVKIQTPHRKKRSVVRQNCFADYSSLENHARGKVENELRDGCAQTNFGPGVKALENFVPFRECSELETSPTRCNIKIFLFNLIEKHTASLNFVNSQEGFNGKIKLVKFEDRLHFSFYFLPAEFQH